MRRTISDLLERSTSNDRGCSELVEVEVFHVHVRDQNEEEKVGGRR